MLLLPQTLPLTSSTSSTSSSPFNCPQRLSSASHTEAWSGPGVRINASEIILGGFRLPFSYCRAGLLFQLFDPSHPLSPTAASSQFLIPSRHSSSSSTPGQDYPGDHHFFTPSRDQHCLPTPPTIDPPQLSSELSHRPIRLHPIHQSSECGLLDVNGELHISFPSCIPRWSSTRGSGDQTSQRAIVNGIPLKNHLFGHLVWNVIFKKQVPMAGYDRRHNTWANLRATSFHILSEPFYISDLSGCLSYGSLLLDLSWMLATACLLTAMTFANGPHHHRSSQYPSSAGYQPTPCGRVLEAFLSINERVVLKNTRPSHVPTRASVHWKCFGTIRTQGIKMLTILSLF